MFDVSSIDPIISWSRLGGATTGGGFVVRTIQGKSFNVPYNMAGEATKLENKLNKDAKLRNDIEITYGSFLFGYFKTVSSVSLSDGEYFELIY